MTRVKMKVVKEGKNFLPVCCLSPPRTALLPNSSLLALGTDQWDQSSGSWALFWKAPHPKTCSGAGWSLAQLSLGPLLLPRPARPLFIQSSLSQEGDSPLRS